MKGLTTRTITFLIALLIVSPGCHQQAIDQRLTDLEVPTDFALVVHIEGQGPTHEPTRHNSQYVVEPNRNFRVALGPGAEADYFPSLTGRLSHQQFEAIYQLIEDNHLTAEPTSPAAEARQEADAKAVYYEVWIRCEGRTHHFATTPGESATTLQLVEHLVRLREPRLPVPTAPNEHQQASHQ